MALVARLEDRALETKELERLFDGNLCRCTGYRPILDAAAVFCSDRTEVDSELGARAIDWQKRWQDRTRLGALFPAAYKKSPRAMTFKGTRTTWFQPVTLSELLPREATEDSLETHSWATPGTYSKMVSGNTDVGYGELYNLRTPRSKISLNHVRELHKVEWNEDGVVIGAGISIQDLVAELEERIPTLPDERTTGLKALHNQCRFFANNQVRNVATVGGGIVNFSHYSDLIPVWVATRATLNFWGPSGSKAVTLAERYNDEGNLTFRPRTSTVLVSITVPYSQRGERVASFKYARRRMDSITFVSAGIAAQFDQQTHVVKNPILCFDGTGSPGLRAVRTEALLSGKEWDEALLLTALQCLQEELQASISNSLPRGLQEYQIRLAQGILLRYYARYRAEFHGEIEPREEQLVERYPVVAHRSYLTYGHSEAGTLGRAVPHINAPLQTTGTAKYSADHRVPNCLHAALVTSPVARGRLGTIDFAEASLSADFVGFYTARDIPGKNLFGFRVEDEEVLASEEVQYVGQPVGVLVARTERAARALARTVEVKVEEHPPLLTVEDAEKAGSFHGRPEGYLLKQGDIEAGFAHSKVVVSGRVDIHGQSHFYLEPHNALVVPKDGGLEIYASTQSPSNVVDHVSRLLGVSDNKISVRVGRLGGGFGGKQFRAGPIAGICALAAHCAGGPVKLVLDRAEDMAYCPGRSPFFATYKAGFADDGAICALDVDFKASGGCSSDYSADITETATLLMDGAYRIDNIRVHGLCLKTNYGSHTATRGFGKPQASAIIESILDHGASALDIDATHLRTRNLYKKGDQTITKMEIGDSVMQQCWNRVLERSNYEEQRAQVEEFNSDNKWLKRGVAAVGSKGNMGFLEADDLNRGVALVHILRDGSVSVNHSGIEMGQGINTRMAQVAAHQLGVPLEQVAVSDTQTALIPNTPPTTMVATDLIGEALLKACNELNGHLAKYTGSFVQRVECAYDRGIPLSAVASHTAPRLSYDYEKQQGDISYFFVWGAAMSIVEIDVISGAFRILKSHIVQDCGKSLNPQIDVGQAEGGFLFGVGYYMMEDLIYSSNGKLITDNVSGYKIPSCGDVPLEWDIELLNYRPEGKGLHNSKGIGESNIQLGLSVYFAAKDAVRAARREAGLNRDFNLGFPASVDKISAVLPNLAGYVR
jgi:xanthine dehydrogenase/oxidase